MDSEDNVDRAFHQRKGEGDDTILNCPSNSMMAMSSQSMFKSDPFNWDTIVPLNPTGNFVQNDFTNSHYSTVNYASDSGLANLTPGFGSGSYSDMVTCFQNSDDGVVGASPNGNRKRKAPTGAPPKSLNADVQLQKEDDKEQRCEENVGANSRNKQVMKQAKDNSVTGEPSKEDYIHVRAKRGQATNSHSLAERVRRERISERMRLLQELVPGCNKITGKAVMLDEIINYVQSLQQQVEFLSMKLATVNPELDVDIERILSKDILQFRGNNPAAALGIGPGLTSSNPFPGPFPGATPPYHQLPQSLWNNDFQSLLQMGFDANPPGPGSNLGSNGHSKMEL